MPEPPPTLRVRALVAAVVAIPVVAMLLPWRDVTAAPLLMWDDALFFVRASRVFWHTGVASWNPGEPATYGATAQLYQGLIAALSPWVADVPLLLAGSTVPMALTAGVVLRAAWVGSDLRPFPQRLVLLALVSALIVGSTLPLQAPTGMDTGLATLLTALWTLRWLGNPGARHPNAAMAEGVLVAAVAWLARPDLVLIPVVATAGLVWDARERTAAWRTLLGMAVGLGLVGLALTWVYGSPLPNAFWVKTWSSPGTSSLRWVHLRRPLLAWVQHDAPLVAGVLMLAWRTRPHSSRVRSALLAGLLFVAWHSLTTVQYMGHFGRFYTPIWPIFAVVGAHLLRGPQAHVPPSRMAKGVVAVLAVCALAGDAALAWHTWRPLPPERAAVIERMHQSSPGIPLLNRPVVAMGLWRTWPLLEELTGLPPECAIATSDLGHPGTLLGLRRQVDLSGLQDRQVAQHGLDLERFFADPPAIVWTSVVAPRGPLRALLEDPRFAATYDVVPAAAWASRVDTALIRQGPCAAPLREAMARARPRYLAARGSVD